MSGRALLVAVSTLSFSVFLAGCGQHSTTRQTSLASKGVSGTVHGGQNPISGATIQLWQVNTTADGGPGTPMLTHTVTSSDGSGAANSNANAGNAFNTLPNGDFTITGAYTCPQGDALVYLTASGGNPGLTAGTNNPQSQMVTALGSCNNLKNNVQFIEISELTTVATVASLYPFMSAYNAIGASPAHAADLPAAFALMNEYVDFQAGTAPGPARPANYSASSGDLNLLANVLAACVNSAGGIYNDGSPCGTLFNSASPSSSNPSTDITAAALFIRRFLSISAGNIASLPAPQAPFQPASINPPDWSLPIFQLPSTPTFSLSTGTYSGTQLINILDADPDAAIYYSFGAAPATAGSFPYSAAITVSQSETINAIAVAKRRVTTGAASAAYTITGAANVPTVSLTSPAIGVGSTTSVTLYASSRVNGTNVDGAVVTFSTSGSLGGTFSPATCTISGGYCSASYTPSGTAPAGTYTNDLTASYTATGAYSATTATGTVFVFPAVTVTGLASGDGFLSPIQASDGNFYGIETGIGAIEGIIFQLNSSENLSTVYTFTYQDSSGLPYSAPQDRLVQATDGSFYGVTYRGGPSGNGSLFKVDALGNFTVLYTFTGSIDGANPQCALIQGTDGSFYGVAGQGGASGNGTAFKVDASGTFTLLHEFTGGADGGGPNGSLLQGADGDFYGTTAGGGAYRLGTVFKMDISGHVTTLYSFTGAADGSDPLAGLVQATDGNFYGTAFFGGTSGDGTLFKIDSSGNFTALHSFSFTDGSRPQGALVQGSDGALYGTASYAGVDGDGSLFKIDLSGNFTLLYSFLDGADGADPDSITLVQGSDGSFYGGNSSALFKLTPSPALAGPVTLTVPTSVTHGSSFTLAYAVSNASSQTMQQCLATNTADTSGWTGIKTASTTATNQTLTAPSTTGAYTYALTCGGTESGFATLNVD